jgi:hypothetical protein
MNKREKIMAIVVVAALVLLLGNAVIKKVFINPLEKENSSIEVEKNKIKKYEAELKQKNRMIQYWKSIDKQSLDADPGDAFLTLSARVTTLINKSGLRDVSVKPISISMKKNRGIDLYYPIAVNLSAKGTLDQIIKFFAMVDNEPYILKLTGYTLRTESENLLSISNCRIESIVLAEPKLEKITPANDRLEITATQPGVVSKLDPKYAMIISTDIFSPKKIPPPPPPKPVVKPNPRPENIKPTPKPVVKGQGKPGDVVGVFRIGESSGAYIRDQREVSWYQAGEDLENKMTLTFVHPLGIVFEDSSGKEFYVEIGDNINQPIPLSEEAIPELYEAFKFMNADK